MANDHVENIIGQWREQRPDLDCSAVAIIGRISRMEKIMRPQILAGLAPFSLSAIEFDILATLRRNNCALTPTQLYQAAMLSSGAMTTNLDKLVKRSLIERHYSDEDRRSCQISLTGRGWALIEEAYGEHLANENRMLEPLNDTERADLARLLKRWLVTNE
ncbi:MAG: MarR family transcriptional regulator [Oceanospirillaceae bacterium]|nr:MarR family transcriptional regulator [Oceanospirillaceae bacterium]